MVFPLSLQLYQAIKEANWQGRSEGMDHDRSFDLRNSTTLKIGAAPRKLPPLSDNSNNAVSSEHITTAVL